MSQERSIMDRREKDADVKDENSVESGQTLLKLWAQVLGTIF